MGSKRVRKPSQRAREIAATTEPSLPPPATPATTATTTTTPTARSTATNKVKAGGRRGRAFVDANGAVDIEEDDGAAPTSEPEQDPDDQLYCICLGHDDHTPMIQCEGCDNWFHFACIGVDPVQASVIEAFYCDLCEETGTGTTKKIEGAARIPAPPSPKKKKAKPKTKSARAASASRSEEEQEEEAFSEADDSAADPDASGASSPGSSASSHASTKQTLRARRTTTASGAPVYRKPLHTSTLKLKKRSDTIKKEDGHADEEEEDLDYDGEKSSKSKRRPRPPASSKKRKISIDIKPPPLVQRTTSGSAALAILSPTNPSSSNAAYTKTRAACTLGLAKVMSSAFEGSNQSRTAQEYAVEAEAELFLTFAEPDAVGTLAPKAKYQSKLRSLLFNLKNNPSFLATLSTLPPTKLAHLSHEDLQTPEQRALAEYIRKQSLKDSVKMVTVAPTVKVTHKGEQAIEVTGIDDERERRREHEVDRLRLEKEEEIRLKEIVERQHKSLTEANSMSGAELTDSLAGPGPGVISTSVAPDSHDIKRRRMSVHSAPKLSLRPEDLGLEAVAAPAMVASEITASPTRDADAKETPLAVDAADEGDNDDEVVSDSELMPPPSAKLVKIDLESVWGSLRAGLASPVTPSTPTMGLRDVTTTQSEKVEVAEDDMDIDETPEGTPEYEPTFETEEEVKVEESGSAAPAETSTLPDDYDPFAAAETGSGDEDLDAILRDDQPSAPTSQASIATGITFVDLQQLPSVWKGNVMTDVEGGFAASAVQVAGRPLGADINIWAPLFPPGDMVVVGRLPVSDSSKYLIESHFAPSRELVVLDLQINRGGAEAGVPLEEKVQQHQQRLIDFFSRKDRHGVVKVSQIMKRLVKDIYLAPLRRSDPLPEFLELLDDQFVPEAGSRTSDMLLAVMVLQKGLIPTFRLPPPPVMLPPPTEVPLLLNGALPAASIAALAASLAQSSAPLNPPLPASAPPGFVPFAVPREAVLPPPPVSSVGPFDPTALDAVTVRALLSNPQAFGPMLESTPGLATSLASNPNLMAAFQSDPSLVQQLATYPLLLNALLNAASATSTMMSPLPSRGDSYGGGQSPHGLHNGSPRLAAATVARRDRDGGGVPRRSRDAGGGNKPRRGPGQDFVAPNSDTGWGNRQRM